MTYLFGIYEYDQVIAEKYIGICKALGNFIGVHEMLAFCEVSSCVL